jgi:hypothetical protein
MHRYLIVANQTLGGGALIAKVRELADRGPARFHVLVPATPPPDHVWTEAEARGIADERLQTAIGRFRELGVEVEGEVGDEHPVEAISELLERESFDEIVLSTLSPGLSRWLKLDLPHRVESSFGLPVTHVIGPREPASREA